jgi:hypothetical protein
MRYAEDYELWLRMVHDYADCRFASLQTVLGIYRIHGRNISITHAEWQRSVAVSVSWTYTKRLSGEAFPEGKRIHAKLCGEYSAETPEELARIKGWLLHLRRCNQEKKIYEEQSFNSILQDKFLAVCRLSLHLGDIVMDELHSFPGMEKSALSQPHD